MTERSDQGLGRSLATQVAARAEMSPQILQALIQDLIGGDLSLRAPLRELSQSRPFLKARPLVGGAENQALCDALLAEMALLFQPALTARIAAFLSGYLGLVPRQVASATRVERAAPETSPHPFLVTSASPVTRLKAESLRKISPKMQERLLRIEALVEQGYSVRKSIRAFPYLVSPSGATINPSLFGKGRVAGFSWIGFFVPFAVCFQIREWSYFWVTGIVYLLASLIRLGTGVSLDLPVNIALSLAYALAIPYLRYLSCLRHPGRQFPWWVSVILGLSLGIVATIPSLLVDQLAPPS